MSTSAATVRKVRKVDDYQTMGQIEHILLRGDSYVGATKVTETERILVEITKSALNKPGSAVAPTSPEEEVPAENASKQREDAEEQAPPPSEEINIKLVRKEKAVSCMGFERLFIEILSNAVDNLLSTLHLEESNPFRQGVLATRIPPITVTVEDKTVTIRNGGEVIPVAPSQMKPPPPSAEGGVSSSSVCGGGGPKLVPDIIFGVLLSSSNYDDQATRIGAGRNGYGAKLTNVYSNRFSVKIADPVRGQTYHGVWERNMSQQTLSKCTPGYIPAPADCDGEVFLDGKGNRWVSKKRRETAPAAAPAKKVSAAKTTYSMNSAYVEISYDVDFSRFPGVSDAKNERGEIIYSRDWIGIFAKYALDTSFTSKFPISFNGVLFDFRNPKLYTRLLFPSVEDRMIIHYEWKEEKKQEKASSSADFSSIKILSSHKLTSGTLPSVELIVLDTPDHHEVHGFVNGLPVPEGEHVQEALSRTIAAVIAAAPSSLTKSVAELSKTAAISGRNGAITAHDVKSHISLIVNCHVENPQFTGQTKQFLSDPRPRIAGLTAALFKSAMTSTSEAVQWAVSTRLHEAVETKMRRAIAKTDAGKRRQRLIIEQGEDANWAGGEKSELCDLYLVEGESASAQIKQRISLLGGKDKNGYFPMKGKSQNVTSASASSILANKEISSVKQLIGLAEGADYNNPQTVKSLLRYGRIIIAADQDVDGFHVRALLVNLFAKWPSLIQSGRIAYLATPLIRVTDAKTGACVKRFFSEASFDAWMESMKHDTTSSILLSESKEEGGVESEDDEENKKAIKGRKQTPPPHRKFKVKYLKGLASSSTAVIKEDITASPCIFLLYDETAKESLGLAFDPRRANDRKRWILNWKEGLASSSGEEDFETLSIQEFLSSKGTNNSTKRSSTHVESIPLVPTGRRGVSSMIHSDLAIYSADTLFRALPSITDGLKKAQRQALFFALEFWKYGAGRRKGAEIPTMKVARIGAATAQRVHYAHGEVSLFNTFVHMAQDFVGSSNNVQLFVQDGQFGTRHKGGKDAGQPRYVSIGLSPLVTLLFTQESVSLVPPRVVEGDKVEPTFLPCDLPLCIINGSRGIASGYSCLIPPHNPIETADWLLAFLAAKNAGRLRSVTEEGGRPIIASIPLPRPWFKGFQGRLFVETKEDKGGKEEDEAELEVDEEEDAVVAEEIKRKSPGKKLCREEGDGLLTQNATAKKKVLVTEGIFEITRHPSPRDPTYDVVVTELPVGMWIGDYRSFLEGLIKEGRLSDLVDHSTPEVPKFTLKQLDTNAPAAAASKSETAASKKRGKTAAAEPTVSKTKEPEKKLGGPGPAPTIAFLKLRKTFSLNNMTTIDDGGNPTICSSIAEILHSYANRMLKHYEAVKAKRLSVIETDLQKKTALHALVQAIVTNKLVCINRPESEILKNIAALKLSAEAYETLSIRSVSKEKVVQLEKAIQELETKHAEVAAFPSWKIWEERIVAARHHLLTLIQ